MHAIVDFVILFTAIWLACGLAVGAFLFFTARNVTIKVKAAIKNEFVDIDTKIKELRISEQKIKALQLEATLLMAQQLSSKEALKRLEEIDVEMSQIVDSLKFPTAQVQAEYQESKVKPNQMLMIIIYWPGFVFNLVNAIYRYHKKQQ